MSCPLTPKYECPLYVPVVVRADISLRIVFDGIAKPKPCESETIAVVMPTTFPTPFSSGPPEFPGFMGALVCIMLAIEKPPAYSSVMVLPRALTTPVVSEPIKP